MKTDKAFNYILAALIIIGFFAVMIYQLWAGKSVDNMMTGALVGSFTTIVGFYFGSSKSSQDKTSVIANGQGKGIVS